MCQESAVIERVNMSQRKGHQQKQSQGTWRYFMTLKAQRKMLKADPGLERIMTSCQISHTTYEKGKYCTKDSGYTFYKDKKHFNSLCC